MSTDTTPTTDTTQPSSDDDAALYEAAAKAWGNGPADDFEDDAEGEGEAPEASEPPPKRGKATPPVEEEKPEAPSPSTPDAPEPPDTEPAAPAAKRSKLAEWLESKEAEHRGRSDYERRQAELETERKALAEQRVAAEKAHREAEERARRLRENPIAAAKEMGLDPEQLMSAATRELSPEARLYAEIHGVKRQLDETKATYEARAKALEDARRADEQRYHEQVRAHEERAFVSQAEDGAPNARLLWGDDRALLREAYQVLDEVRSRGLPIPTNADLIEHLEYRASQEIARIRGSSADPKAAAPAAAKKSGNPLSAKRASERRSAPPRYHELSADEQDAELVRIAAQAMRGGAKAAPKTKAAPADDDE